MSESGVRIVGTSSGENGKRMIRFVEIWTNGRKTKKSLRLSAPGDRAVNVVLMFLDVQTTRPTPRQVHLCARRKEMKNCAGQPIYIEELIRQRRALGVQLKAWVVKGSLLCFFFLQTMS